MIDESEDMVPTSLLPTWNPFVSIGLEAFRRAEDAIILEIGKKIIERRQSCQA